ncbi:MAG: M20 family metallopeptidase [Anaerolineales bacterium]|nr:M20 family metallopeptidase [Anaerolineales bacterium]
MPPLPTSTFEALREELISRLERYVLIETPTTSKEAVDSLGVLLAREMGETGARVQFFPQTRVGDHLLGTWGTDGDGVLLLTHMDTVHPVGTLERMPFLRTDDAIHGPGILDMKVSIAMALTVMNVLQQAGRIGGSRVSLLVTSDEETGSRTSRELIEDLSKDYSVVFCLEPALPDGALKTWRKGILGFEIEARGYAAHAGAEIARGVNAIVEIALQIPELLQIAAQDEDTTLNVGVIQGGSRSNVVPDRCRTRVDVRALTQAEGDRVVEAMHALQPKLAGAALDVRGGWNRPPMERSDLIVRSFSRAQAIAAELALDLMEGGTGGGSDANFVAAQGIPVLDGLGALGRGAHSSQEQIDIAPLAERMALLAALINEW